MSILNARALLMSPYILTQLSTNNTSIWVTGMLKSLKENSGSSNESYEFGKLPRAVGIAKNVSLLHHVQPHCSRQQTKKELVTLKILH